MSPSLRGFGGGSGLAKIPKLHRQTQFPQPPKGVPNPAKRPELPAGPGEPPRGFVTGNTSLSEWYFFWALMKELGPPGLIWGYQIDAGGGAAVADFMVWDREPRLVIRIQTERFHVAVGAWQHLFDHTQRDILEALGYQVIDVYEEHFINDRSGQAVRELCRDALAGVQRPNPVSFGYTLARPA